MKKLLGILIFLGLIAAAVGGYLYYQVVHKANVQLEKSTYFYVQTGSDLDDVQSGLLETGMIQDSWSFKWVSEQKNLANHIHPGRYLLEDGLTNNELVNLLRSGSQKPLQVTFNNIRTKEQLCEKLDSTLEMSIDSMSYFLHNEKFLNKNFGISSERILTMFLPNTYEFNWNTSARQFLLRMAQEYKVFWNDKRKAKASAIGLSQSEVSILASIVEKETLKRDEKPRVAGVYLNRLKYSMLLQADPTLIYAIGDFSIKRVLNIHKEVESP